MKTIPTTRDGVTVKPGMTVWIPDRRSERQVRFGLTGGAFRAHITHDFEANQEIRAFNDEPLDADRWPRDWPVSESYSTKEAALAALG